MGNIAQRVNKEAVTEKKIVNGYWTDEKDEPIKKALITDTVHFHVETEGFSDGEKIRLKIYDDDGILDDHIWSTSVDIKGNKGFAKILLKKDWDSHVDDDCGDEIELYCECSAYKLKEDFPSNSDDYLKVYKVGYYNFNDCKIEVLPQDGRIEWIPEKCGRITRNTHRNYVQNKNNWTWSTKYQQDLGVRNSTLLGFFAVFEQGMGIENLYGTISSNNIIPYSRDPAPTAGLNRSRASGPTHSDTRLVLGTVISHSAGFPQLQQQVMVTGGQGKGRVAGAYFALGVNAVNAVLQYAPPLLIRMEHGEIKDQCATLLTEIWEDIQIALDMEIMISPNDFSFTSFFQLCNILLCGNKENVSDDIYKAGKEIYRQVSNFKKK